jgi:uncharacterized caspase-like protein
MSALRLPDFSSSRAVLIGTGIYHTSELEDLPAVISNLTGIREALTNPKMSGFDPAMVAVVEQPSRPQEIMEQLVAAADQAQDVLLVYYAGHGLLAGDNGELHLGMTGSRTDAPWTSLPYAYMAGAIKDSSAAIKVLILDCCYSGRAFKDLMTDPTRLVTDQLTAEGIYVLTSTSKTKRAKAPEGDSYTAFTGQLLQVIGEGVPGAGELLSMAEIYSDLRQRMRRQTSLPLPEQCNTMSAVDLGLFRNRAYSLDLDPVKTVPPLDFSRSRALIIGSSSYDDSRMPPSQCSVNDARSMHAALLDPSICGFKPEHAKILLDPERPDQILDALAEDAEVAEDVLLLYFSGHGLVNSYGDFLLAMRASHPSRDWTSLAARDVAAVLDRSRARACVVIIDSSFSGRMSRELPKGGECYFLASSGPTQVAVTDGQRGVFSGALLHALENGIPGMPIHLGLLDIHGDLDCGDGPAPQISVSNIKGLRCLFRNRSLEADLYAPHNCLMNS